MVFRYIFDGSCGAFKQKVTHVRPGLGKKSGRPRNPARCPFWAFFRPGGPPGPIFQSWDTDRQCKSCVSLKELYAKMCVFMVKPYFFKERTIIFPKIYTFERFLPRRINNFVKNNGKKMVDHFLGSFWTFLNEIQTETTILFFVKNTYISL